MHGASIVVGGLWFCCARVCTVKSFTLGLCCCVTHCASSNQYRRLILQRSAGGGNHIQIISLVKMRQRWNGSEKEAEPRGVWHKMPS